jgi:ADP-ribose pyrophosphatase
VSAPDLKRTIVIADGLTKDVLSPDHPYRASHQNVGDREIERLIGRGKHYGEGPLAVFLRAVSAATSSDGAGSLILLTPAGDDDPVGESTGAGFTFIEAIEELAPVARVVPAAPGVIPDTDLRETCLAMGVTEDDLPGTRFLVVGCHTDRRVLGLASFLRNVWGCPNVAVSPHLLGSATQEAHLAALRHTLPAAGIEVLLDLEAAAEYAGLDPAPFSAFGCSPVSIGPPEALETLNDAERRIMELLCLHWTRMELRPLAGGFSGSLLFLADGWKGSARTEPLVVKIDAFEQMRRELNGYHQVKDFFGKHVPTFGYPVSRGESIGVGMDLAAMEGRPQTLQDTFEDAESEEGLELFLLRLDKALGLLSEKLYGNTRHLSWVVPYRACGLHTEQQVTWMRENAGVILGYLNETGADAPGVQTPQIEKLLRLIAANEDGVDSEACLSHGDLNFANVICDDGDNIWFIDWTHSGQAPVELDFAKLESDVKFVMSKEFELADLSRLRSLDEYLLSHRIPADLASLPDNLKFVKWDLRFRKILDAVKRIREVCFGLKEGEAWLVYRVALLKYALHTLSFDRRRDRGECELPQLLYALYSVESLVFDLVADDFHLKIRGERPSSYPPRLRISIDEAPWLLDCDGYEPPYHVDPSVLENDRTEVSGGWADPEDTGLIKDDLAAVDARFRDDDGRPLNPHGRTGIAGRGLLGYWGRNLSAAATVTRANQETGRTEILLGTSEDGADPALPKGFVLREEDPEAAVKRVLETEVGWQAGEAEAEVVFEGFTYDRRQTDHAWVETRAFLLHGGVEDQPATFAPGGAFDEIRWWPLDADTVNRLPSDQAQFVRESVTRLIETGRLDQSQGESLLERTG